MNSYLSAKFKVLSFVLICLVVLLHAQIFSLTKDSVLLLVQNIFTSNITRVAVPMFFAISGYLFVYSLDKGHLLSSFRKKIKKRTRTLLIPYLVYNGICLIIVGLISNFVTQSFIGNGDILNYGVKEYLYNWIVEPTFAYQLWFVRDLFLMALLSPLIYIAVKYLREVWMLFLITLCIANINLFRLFHVNSILFFSLGIYICIFRQNWCLHRFKSNWWWLLFGGWIAGCCLSAYFGIEPDSDITRTIGLSLILLGICSLWMAYDLLSESLQNRLAMLDIVSFSFLIFLLHEPMLTVIKKVYIGTIGIGTILSELILYFGSPLITIIICYYIGKLLKSKLPKAYNLLTGGR